MNYYISPSRTDNALQVNIVWDGSLKRNDEILMTEDMILNLKKLDAFASLEKDWDGYDADPLPPAVISKTREVIQRLYRQPKLFPTAADSIQLEYRNSNGGLLAVQIAETGPYESYRRDGKEKGRSFSVQPLEVIDRINELAADFYGQSISR